VHGQPGFLRKVRMANKVQAATGTQWQRWRDGQSMSTEQPRHQPPRLRPRQCRPLARFWRPVAVPSARQHRSPLCLAATFRRWSSSCMRFSRHCTSPGPISRAEPRGRASRSRPARRAPSGPGRRKPCCRCPGCSSRRGWRRRNGTGRAERRQTAHRDGAAAVRGEH